MKTKNIIVDTDFEFILLSSMRYAIGRRSYAVGLIADYIRKVWDKLSDNSKFLLKRDLQEEIDRADRGLKEKFYEYDPLGDKCDRTTWLYLNQWMEERITK